jgi:DNA replication protein DnaC
MAVSSGTDAGGGIISDINITPLTDVMLVLLIIFMVTATFFVTEPAMKVNLPSAISSEQEAKQSGDITVIVSEAGTLFVQNEAVPAAGLVEALMKAAREQTRIEHALKGAGLPYLKTLDEFDFTFQPSLHRQQILGLFDLTFLARKENLVPLGPPGVGKTHLAVALAVKAAQAGHTIQFTTMADLIAKLRQDQTTGRMGRGRRCYTSSLVVVDEVGYTPIDRAECHLFYQFMASRYERMSTVVTSNKAFEEWSELFHDPVIVTAILDRLLHHSTVVNIKGNSYRLKDKLGAQEVRPHS